MALRFPNERNAPITTFEAVGLVGTGAFNAKSEGA
jgi:hypothetical protein